MPTISGSARRRAPRACCRWCRRPLSCPRSPPPCRLLRSPLRPLPPRARFTDEPSHGLARPADLAALAQQAAAANGELGLLEGKAVALVHPLLMAGLYLTTLYTGYQGLKWREVRTVGDDLKALQEQAKPYEAAIAAAGEEGDAGASAALAPLQSQIAELTAKRKDLLAAGYRDKHWALASVLLASGVTFSIEGGVDTYMRVGKLFPGPHLFAGAGITVLWAVAASLVPKMQKGEDWARTLHIGINVVILGLFTWQLPTGFDILTKVWRKVTGMFRVS